MDARIHDCLFAVIRRGVKDDNAYLSLTEEDCRALLQIGRRQSISSILYRGLKGLDVPDDVRKGFDSARLQEIRQFVLQKDALEKISAALDAAQIPYIPLKGAVLRELYPAPEIRTSCDIDMLVHEEELDCAVAAIEAATEFKAEKRLYHDISMRSPTVHLELHFNIKENMDNIDRLLTHVWDYAGSTETGWRYALTPEYQIFHVIAHMSYHMVHGGLGIRPFLDLWLLREKTQYDESALRAMCAECGILTFYEKACALTSAWMAGTPLEPDLTALEDYALNGGVFGNAENSLASSQREKRGFRYLLSRLFMKRSLLETEYPELKKKPYLMPLCQVKRWMRLANPQKRKRVRNEIKGVRTMSAETIDSFDKLLTSLGL